MDSMAETRTHWKIHFRGESVRLWSETLLARGNITIVTLTSDNGVVARNLVVSAGNGVLQ